MVQRTMTGEPSSEVAEKVTEITTREKVAIAPVLAVIVILGFFPQVVLDIVNPAVSRVMAVVNAVDPAPSEGANK
jgi:NADH-quinone oxidoreductase subunit M